VHDVLQGGSVFADGGKIENQYVLASSRSQIFQSSFKPILTGTRKKRRKGEEERGKRFGPMSNIIIEAIN
jgi:hypothetical protein